MEKSRKRELRDLNARAWAGERDLYSVNATLDSSMKKNTTFIKRLRTSITASALSTFLSEISSLSLTKYLSEILSACYEGLCKLKNPADIAAAVEIVSALHQRFGPEEFTKYLGWFLGRGLATPERSVLKGLTPEVREKEEKERLSRQRVLLRVATELWLVGALRSLEDVAKPEEAAASAVKGKDGPLPGESAAGKKSAPNGAKAQGQDAEPFPLEVLKDMLGHDREHVNLPLVVLFVKSFAWDILGSKVASADGRKAVNDDGVAVGGAEAKGDESASSGEDDLVSQEPPLIAPELRERFRNILHRYFEDVKAHIVRDQRHLNQQGRRNAEAYVKSGEVFEDRQANYEKMVKTQDRLVSNAQVLAEAVGGEMPDLKERDASQNLGDGSIGLVKAGDYLRGQGDGPGIWEDEEERRFYENLIDLKDRVPAILLESKRKKTEADEQVGKKADAKDSDESDQKPAGDAGEAKAATDADDLSTAIANKSVGAQVDVLLVRLPEMTNKDTVDDIAVQFCFLNSKASRNRMVKAVQDIPKGRTDLLPLYSRLVATLAKYMPDVAQGIVTYLDEEFKSLQRRKQKEFLGQVRMMNVRYLAELTKFGVVPEHIIFHCLRVCLDDFSRMNIEIMSTLMENCGRYLIRNPETSVRMLSFLETVQRKKSAQHLGQQERMLIENACYYVNPPERAAIEQKERTPVELFLRKLIYLELKRGTLDKVGKQIRKMHWEEPEVVLILRKIFSRPGKLKYSNIHLLAVMLGMLNRYHQDFAISVVDDLLESIIFGLELNDFKYNQRRIAEVKYLGELYIYRMVDSPVIFDTLYKIVTYGHEDGIPNPGKYNPLDPQDDFFRIRLVCNVLETCGVYYSKGAAKKKLDFFLTFFQYYIQTKSPMPMDIEFVVQDAFAATRPQWKLVTSIEQASKEFADAVKQNYQTTGPERGAEDDGDDSSASDDGMDDDQLDIHDNDDDKSSEDEDGNDPDEELQDDHDLSDEEEDDEEEEEENIVVTRPEDERDPELEADFDRELAKMMAESLDSRKSDRKPIFDVPLPIRRSQQRDINAPDEEVSEKPEVSVESTTTMKFSLLSKRGNKQQTKAIDLPSDSSFAVAMRTQQQAEREEQQRIKNLVLNYDLRNEETDAPEVRIQNPYSHQSRMDKAANTRSTQRSRKLQLSDVDWT